MAHNNHPKHGGLEFCLFHCPIGHLGGSCAPPAGGRWSLGGGILVQAHFSLTTRMARVSPSRQLVPGVRWECRWACISLRVNIPRDPGGNCRLVIPWPPKPHSIPFASFYWSSKSQSRSRLMGKRTGLDSGSPRRHDEELAAIFDPGLI